MKAVNAASTLGRGATFMHCMDCTIQAFLLDIVGSSIFATAMVRLMGLYKYLGFLV